MNELWSNQIPSLDKMNPVARLSRDLANASATLSAREVRFLVDSYYIMQDDRKRANSQVLSLNKNDEPHLIVAWLADQAATLENQIKRALDVYTAAHPMGDWMRQIVGIGPVISAGLLAHIDMEKAPTVGHIWSFAGLDPNVVWETKSVRPWNAKLKTLCWKAGQSFMKFGGRDDCYYGQVYKQRKALELERNNSGANKELAEKLASKFSKATDAYKHLTSGVLPPAQIDARARRYAVKLFLSHLHGEWHQVHFGRPAPLPYPIAFGGHVHMIESPVKRSDPVVKPEKKKAAKKKKD